MRIIDKRGKILGKVNLIDFLTVLFALCLLPGFYFGYKIMNKSQAPEVQEVQEVRDYIITWSCPICDAPIEIKIELGQKPERYYKPICPNCRNFVEIRTTSEYKRR